MKPSHLSDKQILFKKALIKDLHVQKHKCGMNDDEYNCFLFEFGVESSLEMSIEQLKEAVNLLANKAKGFTPQTNEEKALDMWRKRAMAAIGGYLKTANLDQSAEYIKTIACQSTGFETFNKIPLLRLQNVYFTFLQKQKDAHKIDFITSELIVPLTTLN